MYYTVIQKQTEKSSAMSDAMHETTPILDFDALMTRVDFDREFAAELMRLFLEDGPKRIDSLRQGINRQDAQLAAKSAHSLKGMSGTLCAPVLMDTALELEIAIKENRKDDMRKLHPRIEDLTNRVLDEITTWLNQ